MPTSGFLQNLGHDLVTCFLIASATAAYVSSSRLKYLLFSISILVSILSREPTLARNLLSPSSCVMVLAFPVTCLPERLRHCRFRRLSSQRHRPRRVVLNF